MKTLEERQGHMYGHFPASVLDTGLRTRGDFKRQSDMSLSVFSCS